MEKHPIGDLMGEIVDKVREIADANTIVGQPIVTGEVTIIPISRLSVGVGSGGTEFGSKHKKPEDNSCFGGGAGAGINLIPVGFLVVKDGSVKLLPVAPPAATTVDRVVEMVPEAIDKITDFIEKQQEKKKAEKAANPGTDKPGFEGVY
ncbi:MULTISPECIES: GerW family sporulation protein [unclassified Flavonifractor]|uniref:GerW family sporulation protein n=1 Tax=unclassified Flavonifractor TaxID=2629267 RepID=UPI000B38E75F|nr:MULTISPECIES: spore germination protein GerW family protein [unclassified Flavonifractor]OUN84634.1 sporulation protein YtfJ [Flavonifractor sp. An52]HIZ93161.1 sporulation protein YtfJ [Candidatus Flavonifractor avicola]